MPNYCENTLIISGAKNKVLDLLAKVKESKEFFNVIRPIPTDLLDIHSGGNTINGVHVSEWRVDDNNKSIAIEEGELATLKEKHGATNQIDWCYKNWGTKWDIDVYQNDIIEAIENIQKEPDNSDVEFNLEFFNTAWNAPLEIYDYLTEQGYEVDAYFYESGCCFYGWYFEGSRYTADYDCFDDIPEEIVAKFAIERCYVDGDDEE